MAEKMGVWAVLCVKRQMQKGSFLLALFVLPLLSWFFMQFEEKDDKGLSVAVYTVDEHGEYEKLFFEELQKQEKITFYRCNSLDKLQKDVNAMEADCGLVLEEKMKERMQQGDYIDLITIYTSPATINVALTKEIIYAEFAKTFGSYWAADKLVETVGDEIPDKEAVRFELDELFRMYRQEEARFHFQYETIKGNVIEKEEDGITPVFPIKGMIGVYMMVIAMFAVTDIARDSELMIYRTFSRAGGYVARFLQVAIPTLITGVFALLSLMVTNHAEYMFHEAMALLLYALLLSMVMSLFYLLLKNEKILSGAIPVVVIGSLIFCPVFIDVQTLFPAMGVVSHLFLPYYYLIL